MSGLGGIHLIFTLLIIIYVGHEEENENFRAF